MLPAAAKMTQALVLVVMATSSLTEAMRALNFDPSKSASVVGVKNQKTSYQTTKGGHKYFFLCVPPITNPCLILHPRRSPAASYAGEVL